MKQVINGLTYNTATATELCTICEGYSGDFNMVRATLYKTKKGRYFVQGYGGASSMFSLPYGQNGWQGGDGIRALSPERALALAEQEMDADEIEKHFGDMIAEA
jgi:hypothetical protein